MKITIAKTAGFCMGVRRAVEIALDEANKHGEAIYTYGPLIHNPQVLALLEEKGIPVLDTIPEKGSGIVLIRAHGVPPESIERLKAAGFKTVDATCPRVIKVQRIIRRFARKGYHAIIIGDKDHPEVIGLNGYAENKGFVVDTMEALKALPTFEQAIIVAQTTQNIQFYEKVKDWAGKNHPNYQLFDTICDSTEKRQNEILQLAESSDAIIIVGGKSSGNTQRLAELAIQAGKPAFHIESEGDLDLAQLADAEVITISAGASTPNWIINRVYNHLESSLVGAKKPMKKKIYDCQQFLLRTNIYLSLGAGSLCYACSKLQGIEHGLLSALVAMMYVLSMHILNHLTAIHAIMYNEPDRAEFYSRNKTRLATLAIAVGGVGLFLVFTMGQVPFVLLFCMSLMGLSYNLHLIPGPMGQGKYKKISDIPGSKTVLISLAWGIVTALLPALSTQESFRLATIPAFLMATGMVFSRTVFYDILDMQGDRIVGQRTLPLFLGDKKTIRVLKWILVGLLIILPLSSALHLISSLGYFLSLFPMMMMMLLNAYERGGLVYSLLLEFLMETPLILTGVIALIWYIS
ncbi:MAG: 4-hydroxy-3-methylbut-2-enyl diphosphate reductase [Proteobacteria bacterium]|nr:4-hydroxy-3-methylbut-2-enyl diphosphate reductase [Pseudomonadota bacterium]